MQSGIPKIEDNPKDTTEHDGSSGSKISAIDETRQESGAGSGNTFWNVFKRVSSFRWNTNPENNPMKPEVPKIEDNPKDTTEHDGSSGFSISAIDKTRQESGAGSGNTFWNTALKRVSSFRWKKNPEINPVQPGIPKIEDNPKDTTEHDGYSGSNMSVGNIVNDFEKRFQQTSDSTVKKTITEERTLLDIRDKTRDKTPLEEIEEGETQQCEPCKSISKYIAATHYCKECEEFFCRNCFDHHKRLKATSKHLTITVEELHATAANNTQECGMCLEDGAHKEAVAMCTDCDPSESMCHECLIRHTAMRATKMHTIETLLKTHRPDEHTKKTSSSSRSQETEMSKVDPFRPGKPAANTINAISIHLDWRPPKKIYKSFKYQIRFKTSSPSDEWKFYEDTFDKCSVILTKLKSNTTFNFQVRMVNYEGEGPYSEISDKITTSESAADRLLGFSPIVPNNDGQMQKRKLILHENEQARNKTAKTRSLYLGIPKMTYCKEKTILLIGETGTGKSTLVDFIINYIFCVNWEDPFRFTLVDLEKEEQKVSTNQAFSQTEWITTYCINNQEGSRLEYTLNIIDTPGFGDTRGETRDKEIVEQLRYLFNTTDETGIVFVDAVCFLVKASDARLTKSQKYIFTAIMALFANNIAENITIFITFADWEKPVVLDALKEENLACDMYFKFNNSSVFADNTGSTKYDSPQPSWEMGCDNLTQFFEKLKTMPTKSLNQTAKVLAKRRKLEITVANADKLITDLLHEVDTLVGHVDTLKKHEADVEANRDFTFTTKTTEKVPKELPKGKRAMICLNCKVTCHWECDCGFGINYMCSVMDWYGNCEQCHQKCGTSVHEKSLFRYETEFKYVTESYAKMEDKFRKANKGKVTYEAIVKETEGKLDEFLQNICKEFEKIAECTKTLHEIAMRPNPIKVDDLIYQRIEVETNNKRPGFKKRIEMLIRCKSFIRK